MFKYIIRIVFLLFLTAGVAFGGGVQPLPVDQAFKLVGTINPQQLNLEWQIAPGYYLYKSQFAFKPGNSNTASIGQISLPQGEVKKDILHGVFQSYSNGLKVALPIKAMKGNLQLTVQYQGCSSKGFCYPPQKKRINVNLATIQTPYDLTPTFSSPATATQKSFSIEDQGYSTQILAHHNLFFIILTFLGLGLLLAFTPCVLPMVPILSSIIAGQGNNISTKKAFLLSLSYVMGMALTYAAAGVGVALLGESIQIAFEKPAVIATFAGLFVVLALSLFGLFEIRLPNILQQRIVTHSNRLQGGTLISVFLMGVLSTLIVSPCVSAPLVGVLAYIGKSGDTLLGGVALLSLGIGMGIPLLLVGMFEGKFLPKAGVWMDKVKQFFGFLMLGVAIFMIQRLVSPAVTLSLWGLLAIAFGFFIWKISHTKKLWSHLNKTLSAAMLVYGAILVVGAFLGNTDPFSPLPSHNYAKAQFTVVNNMQQLDRQLALAKDNGKQVILDFYADWCTSCVIMDKRVFNQAEVVSALKEFVLLRADVTKNDAFDKALQARYEVIAPPTIVFFNANGELTPQNQIVGEINAKEFLSNLARLRVDGKIKYCQGDSRTC